MKVSFLRVVFVVGAALFVGLLIAVLQHGFDGAGELSQSDQHASGASSSKSKNVADKHGMLSASKARIKSADSIKSSDRLFSNSKTAGISGWGEGKTNAKDIGSKQIGIHEDGQKDKLVNPESSGLFSLTKLLSGGRFEREMSKKDRLREKGEEEEEGEEVEGEHPAGRHYSMDHTTDEDDEKVQDADRKSIAAGVLSGIKNWLLVSPRTSAKHPAAPEDWEDDGEEEAEAMEEYIRANQFLHLDVTMSEIAQWETVHGDEISAAAAAAAGESEEKEESERKYRESGIVSSLLDAVASKIDAVIHPHISQSQSIPTALHSKDGALDVNAPSNDATFSKATTASASVSVSATNASSVRADKGVQIDRQTRRERQKQQLIRDSQRLNQQHREIARQREDQERGIEDEKQQQQLKELRSEGESVYSQQGIDPSTDGSSSDSSSDRNTPWSKEVEADEEVKAYFAEVQAVQRAAQNPPVSSHSAANIAFASSSSAAANNGLPQEREKEAEREIESQEGVGATTVRVNHALGSSSITGSSSSSDSNSVLMQKVEAERQKVSLREHATPSLNNPDHHDHALAKLQHAWQTNTQTSPVRSNDGESSSKAAIKEQTMLVNQRKDSNLAGSGAGPGTNCTREFPPFCSGGGEMYNYVRFWNKRFSASDCYTSPLRHPLKGSAPAEERRYLVFMPDQGGWNNIRMAAETAIVLAHSMGRTLVLPPQYVFYLLNKNQNKEDNISNFGKFFDLRKIAEGLDIVSLEYFLENVAKPGLLKAPYPHNVPVKRMARHNDILWHYIERACFVKEWEPGKMFFGFNVHSTNPNTEENLSRLGDGDIHFSGAKKGMRALDRDARFDPFPEMDTIAKSTGNARNNLRIRQDLLSKVQSASHQSGVPAERLARYTEMVAHGRKMFKYEPNSMQFGSVSDPSAADGAALPNPWDWNDVTTARAVYFPGDYRHSHRLLTHFYTYIYWQDRKIEQTYKRIVRDRLHYHDDIFCAAGRVVRLLHEDSASLMLAAFHNVGKPAPSAPLSASTSTSTSFPSHLPLDASAARQAYMAGRHTVQDMRHAHPRTLGGSTLLNATYFAFHIRRGDFQYKDTQISGEEIWENTRHLLDPAVSRLIYVATDQGKGGRAKLFKPFFESGYEVRFLDDYEERAGFFGQPAPAPDRSNPVEKYSPQPQPQKQQPQGSKISPSNGRRRMSRRSLRSENAYTEVLGSGWVNKDRNTSQQLWERMVHVTAQSPLSVSGMSGMNAAGIAQGRRLVVPTGRTDSTEGNFASALRKKGERERDGQDKEKKSVKAETKIDERGEGDKGAPEGETEPAAVLRNRNHIGMIEQVICANAHTFIGTPLSTFTGYITRMRGYYRDGRYERTFYTMERNEKQLQTQRVMVGPFWAREFEVAHSAMDDDTKI